MTLARMLAASVFLAFAAGPALAQPAPAPPSPAAPAEAGAADGGVFLIQRPDDLLLLAVQANDDGSITLVISSVATQCRFPESIFELPIRINGTGFQLKHVIRPSQERSDDGTCAEGVVTAYRAEDYWPIKNAHEITLHLPFGTFPLSEEARKYVQALTPSRPPDNLPAESEKYVAAVNQMTMALSAGKAGQVRDAAEALLPAFATRPPEEGMAFFATLGMARRMTGDLGMAASSFEVAAILGSLLKGPANVGVIYDNLATVRRLQKRWPEAEAASDRAIASLESIDQPLARQALGGVYNNRALILAEQGRFDAAVDYSEKALVLLKVAFKDRPKELAPFLEDNKTFREQLGRR